MIILNLRQKRLERTTLINKAKQNNKRHICLTTNLSSKNGNRSCEVELDFLIGHDFKDTQSHAHEDGISNHHLSKASSVRLILKDHLIQGFGASKKSPKLFAKIRGALEKLALS